MWTRRHLVGLEDLTREEITAVLDRADAFAPDGHARPGTGKPLAGKTVLLLFFEPSTRTSTSFEIAARNLGAGVLRFTRASSSTAKGETLIDTARNIAAMGPVDVAVIRHAAPGASELLARSIDASVVNAGDGSHEHPTQGLLDVLTIRRRKGAFEGLKVAIVGDIAHSRVARSDIFALNTLGADVTVCGPATLIPEHITDLGVRVTCDFDALIPEMDVINMLRIQHERMTGPLLPSNREYTRLFGLTRERERRMKPDALVMHPGPINRGVE
ncbi:MAG TPA: aspartate carbamoyltransferase catalytic subunit, partial [Planctomycetota bacterium]|nr:aspartate carbamoyltransferase catalytic subunit [Planctomycetota bacterium]